MTSLQLRDAACLALWTWLLVDLLWIFTKYSRRAKSADRGSLWGLFAVLWIGIAAAMIQSYRAVGALGVPMQLFGFAVMAFGIGFRFLAIHQLGRLHMPVVAIQVDHPLMDRGLYSRVRHPSYLGAILALTGFGFALGNGISALMVVAAALISYGYRMHVEEIALVEGLGERYADYQRRTKRLIPWIY
ncbi:MAG TPA: isoprenylcysteine carboxylmethyltransferase family protein [Gammaproteobacteria bacterium]